MLLRMTSAEFRDYISKMPDNTMLVVEFDNGEDDVIEDGNMEAVAVKQGEEGSCDD